jgi:hypothetical protein
MEYIVVRFDPSDIRDVLANASAIGKTEKTIMLDTGFYEISLSGEGFSPQNWTGSISATNAIAPFSIAFTKTNAPTNSKPLQEAEPPAPTRKRRRKRRSARA